MRWKKLKKMLIMHPNMFNDDFKMSFNEAEKIQNKEGYPSFDEMVSIAKRKSNLPTSTWAPVDAVIKRRQSMNDAVLNNPGWSKAAKRCAIAGLCAILLACYLAFTPS